MVLASGVDVRRVGVSDGAGGLRSEMIFKVLSVKGLPFAGDLRAVDLEIQD